ncbi:MAG: hypothetical protein Q7R43_06200 [Candidatus Daviesbacteria bacterium]|nr:hypothetical protein [Candidatus Daviesbacteria bacterium]
MTTENEISLENTLTRFQKYPLSDVPIKLFFDSTELQTRKVNPLGNMIIAQANWKDPQREMERAVMLGEDKAHGYKKINLSFYGRRIEKGFPTLIERLHTCCDRDNFFPDYPELVLETSRPYENHPIELRICLGTPYYFEWIPLEYRPENLIWIFERALEATKLARKIT